MDMNINVYLRGGGQTSRAKSKTSAKKSFNVKQLQSPNKLDKVNKVLNTMNKVANLTNSAVNVAQHTITKSAPVAAAIMMILRLADKGIQFGANIYEAHSGNIVKSSNIKAMSKTVSSLGINLLSDGIKHALYELPVINRQNRALDYNRQLYLRNVENGKNQFV